jgi:acetyl esterase
LTKSHVKWYRKQYLPDEKDRKNPYASPLLADNLSKVPPALVLTGEFDVVRDDGESYVRRLKEAGVSARFIRYANKGHMAYWITSSGTVGDAQYQMAFALQAAFQRKTTPLFKE